MKNRWKRTLAWMLAAVLLSTMSGPALYAEESAEKEEMGSESGLCEHHPEHDEECGYREAKEGVDCTCGYKDAEEITEERQDQENGGEEAEAEGHAEDCAYQEAAEGAPCTYICKICGGQAETDAETPDTSKEPSAEGMDQNQKDTGNPGETDVKEAQKEPGVGEDQISEEESKADQPEQEKSQTSTEKRITSWFWADEESSLTDGALLLPEAEEEQPIALEEVKALLPEGIQATVEEAEEPVTLKDWICEAYPEEGAYIGSYQFRAVLPKGYALTEEAEPLELTVKFEESVAYELAALSAEPKDVSSTGLVFDSANQLPTEETTYPAGDGEIVWTPVVEGGKVVSGSLLCRNISITGCRTGIWMPVPVEIVLEGKNRIEASSNGIYMSDISACVTLRGSGSLEIDSSGGGIIAGGAITVDQVGGLSITYGSQGLWVTQAGGGITIQSCEDVKVKSSDNASGSNSAIGLQNAGEIMIKDSHVLLTCGQGPAIGAATGEVELLSSDVRAIGNTSTENASGTLSYGHLSMTGGTLYLENTGSDEGLPLVSGRTELIRDAVVYFKNVEYVPQLRGDGVWYMDCTYNETEDSITKVGNGHVLGNVTWNDRILLYSGMELCVGLYGNATCTIPEGMVVEIPGGCKIGCRVSADNQSVGTLVNQGTLRILDGAGVYNYYNKTLKMGGTVQNSGTMELLPAAVFQNRFRLENSGTINTAGNFSVVHITGYDAVLENTGIVNGFVIEMLDTSYNNIASGNTVIQSGQMLTVGQGVAGSGSKDRTLEVPEGATLTIESGAVVDAKTNVTTDTLSQYLQIDGDLAVNGTLLLPENVSDETLQELAEHISGTGKIQVGSDATAIYYIATVTEGGVGASGRGLYQKGVKVAVDAGAREGCRFRGWSVSGDVVLADPASPQTTFVMPEHAVTLTAEWEILVSGVTLNQTILSLLPGETALLHATVSPSNASEQGVVWASDHPEVALVDQDGRVTAVAVGTAVITVTSSEGGKTAQCTVTVREEREEPTPPADTDKPTPPADTEEPTPPVDTQQPEYRLIFEPGMREIPRTLLEKGLDTPEKIAFVLKLEILKKQESFPQENMALYDVTLLVRRPGSGQWEIADASNFPADGRLQVILPYPPGTGRDTHDFQAAHMFTTDDFGKTPGEVETPEVTKTSEGLRMEVTGLSPILLTWKEIRDSDEQSRPSGRPHRGSNSSDESVAPADTAAAQPIQSAKTGDNAHPEIWCLLLLISCAGIGRVFRKKIRCQ
ncbi:MAG: hypothetical protein HFI92_07260 [Lachnospiraceae bacterium]|nr:hypothetical protein [Lachnospiraceae bacterium]